MDDFLRMVINREAAERKANDNLESTLDAPTGKLVEQSRMYPGNFYYARKPISKGQ